MAPPFVELVRRIHGGALGEIASGAAHYFCGALDKPAWPGLPPAERGCETGCTTRVLSGDILVEQNIHVIDICNWVLKGHPVKAVGSGGRKGRTDPGNASSHFSVVFTYPQDVHVGFSSTQFGKGSFDANERFFGPRGNSTSPYAGPVAITGESRGPGAPARKPREGSFRSPASSRATSSRPTRRSTRRSSRASPAANFHNQAALAWNRR